MSSEIFTGLAGGGGFTLAMLLVVGLVFVLALVGAARALFPAQDAVVARLERITHQDRFGEDGAPAAVSVSPGLRPLLSDDRPRSRAAEQLGRLLTHAGYRSERAVHAFLVAKVVLAAGLPLAYWTVAPALADTLEFPLPVTLLLCASGFFAPNLWLYSRVRSRQILIENALPDAMDLLVTCVEAGLGLDAALARVADEIELSSPVLSAEMKTTFLEIQAGMNRAEAFRRLASRTGVEDLKALAAALTQTEIFGTSISQALRIRAEWMRTRRMQQAEERAAIVAVKMTIPLVFCILPSLLAIIMGPAIVRIAQTLLPHFGTGG